MVTPEASLVAQLVNNPPADAGDMGLLPASGRSPGGRNGNPFQYSYLGNPMDRGAGGLQSMGLAAPAGGGWGARSAPLPEGRGLLQLSSPAPTPPLTHANTRVDTGTRALSPFIGIPQLFYDQIFPFQ